MVRVLKTQSVQSIGYILIRQQENSGDTMQKKQEKDSIRQILAIFKNKKAFLFVISLAIFSIAWLLINFFYVEKLENCGLPVEWMSLIISVLMHCVSS